LVLGAAALTAACGDAPRASGPWEDTGELIALSGGDAGARGACATCHGLAGEGDGDHAPRLAGLDAGYIARQLEFYAAGHRRHPQMAWIADRLDWDARQKVAFYYAGRVAPQRVALVSLPADACAPATARLYHEGDARRGIQGCAACHGVAGEGAGAGNPPLAGQPAPYLAEQLRQWRRGERYGDPLGVMTHVSRLLAEEEVDALSAYAAHLPGSSSSPGPPAACLPARRRDPRCGA
jgi:cytochrome c553